MAMALHMDWMNWMHCPNLYVIGMDTQTILASTHRCHSLTKGYAFSNEFFRSRHQKLRQLLKHKTSEVHPIELIRTEHPVQPPKAKNWHVLILPIQLSNLTKQSKLNEEYTPQRTLQQGICIVPKQ